MNCNPINIRPVDAGDLTALHAVNEAAVPGVGSVTRQQFAELVSDFADLVLVAARDDQPLGFVLCMLEGTAYASPNYRWIAERYPAFAYVDRIATAERARGLGVGGRLYNAAIDHYRGVRPALLAEVNLAPPNPGSLRFHERHGFAEVGQRWSEDRRKGVVYLAHPLADVTV